MTLIRLNWSELKGEGSVNYTKQFIDAHIVTQLDMLQDCIAELSDRYNKIMEEGGKKKS